MKTRAFVFIILAGLMWGTSGLFVHAMAPYGFTALQMTALRGTVAFLALLCVVLLRSRAAFRLTPKALLLYIGIGIMLFGTAAAYFAAMQLTSVATAVVLMYTAPIYVTVFSVLFLGERFHLSKGVAVACMLIGCCLVSGILGGMRFHVGGFLLGMLSGISYGVYNILTKIAMQQKCMPTSTTLYGFFVMAMIAISVCQPSQILTNTAKRPALLIPLILLLGIVTYVVPYLLYTLAMRDLPAGTASALGIVEPMSATIFSILFLDEPITVFSVIGIIMILGAVFLLGRSDQPVKSET